MVFFSFVCVLEFFFLVEGGVLFWFLCRGFFGEFWGGGGFWVWYVFFFFFGVGWLDVWEELYVEAGQKSGHDSRYLSSSC